MQRWRSRSGARRLTLPDFLRRRRRVRLIALPAVALLLLVALLDHRGCLLYRGNDSFRYDGRTFNVVRVIDGATLVLAAADDKKPETRVGLLGIDGRIPQPVDDEAAALVRSLCDGQSVRLALERSRMRDATGRLMAHVWLSDGTSLNERLLAAGLARADERWTHQNLRRFVQIQKQAQHDRLGQWGLAPP